MLNYSVELWGNYNLVQKTLHSHIQGLNELITIFIDKYNSEQNLCKCLYKSSEEKSSSITFFESLSEGILGFKGDMVNQFNYLNEYLNGLKDEIINPLKNIYQTLIKKLNNNSTEVASIYKTYQASINQLELSKNRFHASVKEAEQNKLRIEYFKTKLNNIKSKNNEKNDNKNNDETITNTINGYNNAIKQEELKLQDILKIAKENEQIYINLINYTNKLQEDYIEIKNKNLNQIQDLEEELGECVKDTLRKFIVFQVAYLRNMQYDIDKKAKIFESINIKNDINNFIISNKKELNFPSKIEYEPYISILNKDTNNAMIKLGTITPEKIEEIKNFMLNIFPLDRTDEIKLLKNKTQYEIETLVEKIFSNKRLEFEETKYITKLILNKKLRRLLLNEINNYRIKTKEGCLLKDKAYDTINEILKESLNILQIDKDFESAKIIINLSNTLYKNTDDENKTKILMNSSLKNENGIKSFEFWKELIKYNIIEERQNKKIFGLYSGVEDEDNKTNEINKKEINEIVENKLKTFIKYMMEFECRYFCIKQIIQEFGEYYQLKQNVIDELIAKADDYENNQINKTNENTIIAKLNNVNNESNTDINTDSQNSEKNSNGEEKKRIK